MQRIIQNYNKQSCPQYLFHSRTFSFDHDDVRNSNNILAQISDNVGLKSCDFLQRMLLDYRHREEGKSRYCIPEGP